jgi:hypothetical protein
MIKKQLPLIAILLVLLVVVAYFVSKNKNTTYSKNESSFAVTDTALITKIVLCNDSDTLVLTKHAEHWRFNNGFSARNKAIIPLIEAVAKINVKSAVSKDDNKKVIEGFQKNFIEVKIFNNSKVLRNYILQMNPVDPSSIFILTKGLEKPFLAELPGFTGNIYNFFRINEHYWRDKTLFSYNPNEILFVSVQQNAKENASYRILNFGNNRFAIKPIHSEKNLTEVNKENLEIYLNSFKNITVDNYIKSAKLLQMLQTGNPDYSLVIKDIHGNETSVKTYPIKLKNPDPKTGSEYDMNYFYILLNNNELAIAKYVVFDSILKDIDYFSSK